MTANLPSPEDVVPPSSSRRHSVSDPHDSVHPRGTVASTVGGDWDPQNQVVSEDTVGCSGSTTSRYTGRAVPGAVTSEATLLSPTRRTRMEAGDRGKVVLVAAGVLVMDCAVADADALELEVGVWGGGEGRGKGVGQARAHANRACPPPPLPPPPHTHLCPGLGEEDAEAPECKGARHR